MKDHQKLQKEFLKSLHLEKKRLAAEIGKIDSMLQMFSGNTQTTQGKRGSKKGRKLSAAHKRAIREGIAKSKARKAGREQK